MKTRESPFKFVSYTDEVTSKFFLLEGDGQVDPFRSVFKSLIKEGPEHWPVCGQNQIYFHYAYVSRI